MPTPKTAAGFLPAGLNYLVKREARNLGLDHASASATPAVATASTAFYVQASNALAVALQRFPPDTGIAPESVDAGDLMKQQAAFYLYLYMDDPTEFDTRGTLNWARSVWKTSTIPAVLRFCRNTLGRPFSRMKDAVVDAAIETAGA